MRQVPVIFPFSLALFTALFATSFFPHFRFFAFAPFLAILYMRHSFITSLWLSSLCGLIIDLLTSDLFFGIHTINYTLTTFLLFKQKRHFFDDKPLALSLFTGIISSFSTLLQLLLMYAFSRKLPISFGLFISDLVAMPFFDALYAFLWFTCPLKFYIYVKRVGWRKIISFTKESES